MLHDKGKPKKINSLKKYNSNCSPVQNLFKNPVRSEFVFSFFSFDCSHLFPTNQITKQLHNFEQNERISFIEMCIKSRENVSHIPHFQAIPNDFFCFFFQYDLMFSLPFNSFRFWHKYSVALLSEFFTFLSKYVQNTFLFSYTLSFSS